MVRRLLARAALLGLLTGGACTSLKGPGPAAATGGAGGLATGGALGTGGISTGGVSTGGTSTGGISTGGISTGGMSTGGISTGGVLSTGGTSTGGISTGGMATGGSATGGAGDAALASGCALIMHMDEPSWTGASGEVLDSCGHHDGTAIRIGGPTDLLPTTTAGGRFGRAGLFYDSTGCILVADTPSLRPSAQLTAAAWVYPTALSPASNGILSKRTDYKSDSSYALFLWYDLDTAFHLYADIGNDRFVGKATFDVNTWYHVALVFDGSLPVAQRVRLYVNGALDGEFAVNALAVPAFETPLHIACMPSAGISQAFVGQLDEVAIWNRALGPADILRLAQATAPL